MVMMWPLMILSGAVVLAGLVALILVIVRLRRAEVLATTVQAHVASWMSGTYAMRSITMGRAGGATT